MRHGIGMQVEPHRGPHLGMLAIMSTVLFCAGLALVNPISGKPYFPRPWEWSQTIALFFKLRGKAALLCAFLQFGSAIPLGVFAATIYSRLNFLGVRAAGASIAMFGGLAASSAIASSALVLWVTAHNGVAQDSSQTQALYLLSYALGGLGYAVALGHLIAGISASALFYRLAPRWIAILGFLLAVTGVLSWFYLYFEDVVFLIPLTRFFGFVWMIAMGFALPTFHLGVRTITWESFAFWQHGSKTALVIKRRLDRSRCAADAR